MNSMKELKRPVIIFGTGRSGTTIISSVIFRHNSLAFPSNYQERFPKTPHINYIRHLFDNKLWRALGQKKELNKVSVLNKFLFKPGENYEMWEYLSGPEVDFSRGFLLGEEASPERQAFIRAYFRKMVRKQGRQRLGMKITGPSRLKYMMSLFPDACFVHITRDLIPTISSFLKVSFWKERGMNQLWWQGPYTEEEKNWVEAHRDDPVLITALQLRKTVELTEKEIGECRPDYLRVRYEDFVAHPRETILEILGFAGLEEDEACMQFIERHKIQRRNKPDHAYFPPEVLERLSELLDNGKLVAGGKAVGS